MLQSTNSKATKVKLNVLFKKAATLKKYNFKTTLAKALFCYFTPQLGN